MTRAHFVTIVLMMSLFSTLVLYPIVHEGGHYIVGRLFGVKVNRVVWTVLGGGRPHVSFAETPGRAVPWINAGGILLPTAVGFVLMCVWICCAQRMSWLGGTALWIPGLVLLAGNFGLVIEVARSESEFHHMRRLAQHLGLTGLASGFFEVFPALLSLGMVVLFFRKMVLLKRRCRTTPNESLEET